MPNQLSAQTSPYLLQHAHNPVDWYPWDAPALAHARQADKPILLSIGYSACHWCHVMERECFEDANIAQTMNQHFVCIKVDREERPDLDKIYQTAHQMLTQRPGGWPLNVALTPADHAPFFAGTYFPPQPRLGLPGFAELLERIAAHYARNRADMAEYARTFHAALIQLNPRADAQAAAALPQATDCLNQAAKTLEQQFDPVNGGFGSAPKFPHPKQVELLQRHARGTAPSHALSRAMADKTLQKMAQGGLFDQLGGGFYRYSVDKHWCIPHFEKMLYDNAQLLSVYCDQFQCSREALMRDTAAHTAAWVMAEMQQAHGGYASTLDADTEGVEGKYYVWSELDLRAVLSEDEYRAVEYHYGLVGEPNFEGNWHFNVNLDNQHPVDAAQLAQAKQKLLNLRQQRVRPALDDKILTAWNGLMLKGMARAGRILQRADFIDSAAAALDFVRTTLWQQDRLCATTRQGQTRLNGYLDDYAFLLEGILELCQARWRSQDLVFAEQVCDAMLAKFEDPEEGGFFFTANDHESLLYRVKAAADDAIPNGNGAAVSSLVKLGHLLGNSRYLQAAERALKLFAPLLNSAASVHGGLTLALLDTTQNTHVILRGQTDALHEWQTKLDQTYHPTLQCYAIPTAATDLPAAVAVKAATDHTVAYRCQGVSCGAPIESLDELLRQLAA